MIWVVFDMSINGTDRFMIDSLDVATPITLMVIGCYAMTAVNAGQTTNPQDPLKSHWPLADWHVWACSRLVPMDRNDRRSSHTQRALQGTWSSGLQSASRDSSTSTTRSTNVSYLIRRSTNYLLTYGPQTYITGIWGRSLQWRPRAEPQVTWSRAKPC